MADEPTQQPPEEKPEEKKEESAPVEQPVPSEEPKPTEETSATPPETPPVPENQPPAEEQPKTSEPQPENPPQQPQPPESPKSPEPEVKKEVPVITQEDVDKQITEKLKQEQDERRKLANEARTKKKSDNLNRLLDFAKEKKVITNDDARDFLHVSQSTATNYLSELVKSGKLEREGQRGGTKYSV